MIKEDCHSELKKATDKVHSLQVVQSVLDTNSDIHTYYSNELWEAKVTLKALAEVVYVLNNESGEI